MLLLGNSYDLVPLGGPHSANLMAGTAVADPPFLGSNDLEDGGIGVLLVRGFSGRLGDDLNPDNPPVSFLIRIWVRSATKLTSKSFPFQ